MRLYKFLLASFGFIGILSFIISGVNRVPIEKVSIASGIGYDIEKNVKGNITHSVPASYYIIENNKKSSKTVVTKGKTLAETREDRQRKLDKKLILGYQRVYLISEEQASYGIRDIIDILFNSTQASDTTLVCICRGKAEDILKLNVDDYPSSADFIEGLLKYSSEYNFYPNNYKFIDVYARVDSEGRNLVLPCIEYDKENNIIKVSGLAIFKKDKMTNIIGIKEAKILNLLRETNIMGMITYEENPNIYINYYGKSKRKVECKKEGEKYKFVINLKVSGEVVANEKYKDIINSPKNKKEAEEKLAEVLTKEANDFISIMKNEHEMDCLELGRIACAKYGRDTGVDWNEIVKNSDISVNVDIKIERLGKGDY